MLHGFRPVTNLLGVGDPDVHQIDGQWRMFFGGFHTGFANNLFSASLPPGAPLSSNEWNITTTIARPRRAAALIDQPPKGSWDAKGLHTPSYVVGKCPVGDDTWAESERIYYAGRNSGSIIDNKRPISIGVLERCNGSWFRHPDPVLTGTREFPSVLEPKVRYFAGKWRIWYAATPRVAGKSTRPIYEIRYVESADGIRDWTEPTILFSTKEAYFDTVVTDFDDYFGAVVCRSGNLASRLNFPPQGLWWMTSATPSGNRQDWSCEPLELLRADMNSENWYANGVLGPSVQHEYGTTYVFFTGINRETSWPKLALHRLAAGKLPPFPAPFYLSIGRAQYTHR